MKNKLLIKNSFSKKHYSHNKYVKNCKIILQEIDKIKVDLDIKKNNFNFLSKKFLLNFKKKDLNRFKKFNTIIVVGIGGSILGLKSIYSFLKDQIKKDFIFIDNLSAFDLKQKLKKKKFNQSLFIFISKSGSTLETLTNLNIIDSKVKLHSKNTICITEKKDSALYNYAKQKKMINIEHYDYIGGRYSVLSEVGMVPAYLMGLDIKKFRKNLLFFLENKKLLSDSVAKISQFYLSKKINSMIIIIYNSHLNHFGYWLQQLMAESLGKKGLGILPVVSIAPKDHHSLLQLYLDGPKDKIYYVIDLSKHKGTKVAKNNFTKSLKYLNNKKIEQITNAQKNSFIEILKKKDISFREIKLKDISEETIGSLFGYFMLETALIGKVIKVNPFDQPAVESVKILTKKYLSQVK